MGCYFCENAGGEVLWEDDACRAVWAYEPDHPGTCRVIWDKHVKEMTELKPGERDRLMRVVLAVEQALLAVVQPDKINLASLGNQVPHVHWHVIPRFLDDPHFPNPVWGGKLRQAARALPDDFSMRMRKTLDSLLKPRGLVG
jgi:diadenosine tetraphosphate (Ap4A) HIT family hydrolase